MSIIGNGGAPRKVIIKEKPLSFKEKYIVPIVIGLITAIVGGTVVAYIAYRFFVQ